MDEMHREDVSVSNIAEIARDWFLNKAIPLWSEAGVDRAQGGFFDQLDGVSAKNACSFKRLRVTCRQIFVFATAAELGMSQSDTLVKHGTDYLLGTLRHPDGGFISRVNLSGASLDVRRDFYDNSFALFAMAHAFRRSRNPALLAEALKLLEVMDVVLRHPLGGYRESCQEEKPRRQNPHMHLFEAVLAWLEAMPEVARFRSVADELVELFILRFHDVDAGMLLEYFADDWSVERPVAEAGHHMEWVWLLAEYERLTGFNIATTSLYDAAIRHGLDPRTGFLRGAFAPGGIVVEQGSRLWPHAEWVRAETVLESGRLEQAWIALSRFLDHPLAGLWYERQVGDGTFEVEPVPASSLYHIAGAVKALQCRGGM